MIRNIFLSGVFACITVMLSAQKNGTDTLTGDLDDIYISANKWEQNRNEIPNAILRVSRKQAILQNPQTAADLLGMTGQVFIQKSQLGGGSPMIRGFSTNRVLIVVDGVRMNNAIYRSGNLQNLISLDALSTQSAEVVFGPGSIIYGSDAIGGVMDFHTLQPTHSNTTKMLVKANGVIRHSTANNEQTSHLDLNLGFKKWALLGSATYSDFGDLKMGKNGGQDSYLRNFYVERINGKDSVLFNPDPYRQKQTGYHQLNALAKLRFKPNEHWDLQYAYHYSATGNVPRYDRLIELTGSTPTYAEWYYGPQVWKMHQVRVDHATPTTMYDDARLILAIQDYEESRNDRRINNARLRNQTETVDVFSGNLDFDKKFGDKAELFYGLEYVHNSIGSVARRTNINNGSIEGTATRYPDNSTWASAGLYSSLKTYLSKKATLSTGIRYNHVTLNAPFDSTYFKFPFHSAEIRDGAVTGNIGLVLRPSTEWQLNANLSTGFRVPNIDDLGKVFDSEVGNVIVPNPNLQAEYAYNADLGIAGKISDKLTYDLTVFHTILDNAIVRRPFTFNGEDTIIYEGVRSRVQALQNVARAKVWGVQAGYNWKFAKHFSWETRANYIDGRETDDTQNKDVQLRHAPPFYGRLAIAYEREKLMIELSYNFNGSVAAANLAPSEQSKPFIYATNAAGKPYSPSWYTLNLKSVYRFSKHLTATAGFENLTNQRYRVYSSGIVSPGTNFIVSLRAGI
ncbi:TonB-dependent receptor [Segetibacter sp. 3557_3]|uniref:TonB-dependent receptor n=1 Tax=Segetibacter sp. 3557_3 TaxID=2547429 RepID=UPI001058B9F9|nr:TonB-dependent receptor [Segetibacter sp. 3557_3]TDH26066.1 TonB-dependent receptor [Segetibacter sp. 3557_3]